MCCFNYTGEENVSLPIIDGGTFLYSMLQSLHQEELLNRTSVPISPSTNSFFIIRADLQLRSQGAELFLPLENSSVS